MRLPIPRLLAFVRATATLSIALTAVTANTQPPARAADHAAKPAPGPTPRLPDGTVDLGGDGIWSQPWITDFSKNLVGGKDAKIPFLPWTKAMYDYNAANKVVYDPEGFCLPPGGPRMFGTPYPSQFLQQPKRIIVIFEGGAHVWREIHMDGRKMPPLEDINPTYFGYAIGHWEGDTLVVETTGFNEKSWLNFNGTMHTEQLRTIEKFTRPNRDTLHYEATIIDPGAYSEPWTVAWNIPWTAGAELTEYVCQENNQFLLKLKDDFGNPFFEDRPVEHLGSKQ
jgi:hypothetical protein